MKERTQKRNKGRDSRIINKMILKLAKKQGLSVGNVEIGKKETFSKEAADVLKKFKEADRKRRDDARI